MVSNKNYLVLNKTELLLFPDPHTGIRALLLFVNPTKVPYRCHFHWFFWCQTLAMWWEYKDGPCPWGFYLSAAEDFQQPRPWAIWTRNPERSEEGSHPSACGNECTTQPAGHIWEHSPDLNAVIELVEKLKEARGIVTFLIWLVRWMRFLGKNT